MAENPGTKTAEKVARNKFPYQYLYLERLSGDDTQKNNACSRIQDEKRHACFSRISRPPPPPPPVLLLVFPTRSPLQKPPRQHVATKVWAPEDDVHARAARRAERTGRVVPPSTLEETYRAVPKSVEMLAPLVDYCVRIDNVSDDPDFDSDGSRAASVDGAAVHVSGGGGASGSTVGGNGAFGGDDDIVVIDVTGAVGTCEVGAVDCVVGNGGSMTGAEDVDTVGSSSAGVANAVGSYDAVDVGAAVSEATNCMGRRQRRQEQSWPCCAGCDDCASGMEAWSESGVTVTDDISNSSGGSSRSDWHGEDVLLEEHLWMLPVLATPGETWETFRMMFSQDD